MNASAVLAREDAPTQEYSEILEKRSNMGEQMDLSTDFVKEIFKEIHEESVRQQMIIMNEQ